MGALKDRIYFCNPTQTSDRPEASLHGGGVHIFNLAPIIIILHKIHYAHFELKLDSCGYRLEGAVYPLTCIGTIDSVLSI
jgi:hypothetical protein